MSATGTGTEQAAEASVYRCVECGHGKHLMAWAPASAYGPVAADGDLAQLDDVWDDGVHEDSLECSKHPHAVIEKHVDGQWCRPWVCRRCDGKGVDAWNRKCPEKGMRESGPMSWVEWHRGWRPIEVKVGDQA